MTALATPLGQALIDFGPPPPVPLESVVEFIDPERRAASRGRIKLFRETGAGRVYWILTDDNRFVGGVDRVRRLR